MRIIHCADLHLDSRMTTNFDSIKARERKAEILDTFVRMVRFAADNKVEAILIAGDMFDTGTVSLLTRNTVLETIINYPDITFFYLKGNHDKDGFIDTLDEVPGNLKLFNEKWNSYKIKNDSNVIVTATELSAANCNTCYDTLKLDDKAINIVMLHGQEMNGVKGDNAQVINIRELRNKGIDYLALGHIHSYRKFRMDGRGVFCYPGCLEGRGFDEPGQHGFVLLDINELTHEVTRKFIPFAKRDIIVINVDISECENSAQILKKIEDILAEKEIAAKNMLQVVLTGEADVEAEKNTEFLKKSLEGRFYFVKVTDKSVYKVNFEQYRHDESLKGEFVRKVMSDELMSDERKAEIISMGLKAIAGEEIDICD